MTCELCEQGRSTECSSSVIPIPIRMLGMRLRVDAAEVVLLKIQDPRLSISNKQLPKLFIDKSRAINLICITKSGLPFSGCGLWDLGNVRRCDG